MSAPYRNPDGEWVVPRDMPSTPVPGASLSVSDVERLAKAGVTINFEEIRYQVHPDQPKPVVRTLIDAFWERWRRAHSEEFERYELQLPYQIAAVTYGDNVYVFVAPRDAEPFVLQDDRRLYPSDALMAKVSLFEKSKS